MELEFLNKYWGINENIFPLELAARGVVMFIIAFIIIRLTGMRAFRENNPFDLITAFFIGGILSRGVVGATPFFSALTGAIVLILLHKVFLKLTLQSSWFENIIKGQRCLIYKDGKFIKENMRKADITTLEVYEDLRADQQTESLEGIDEIYVEKTGEISFIKK